MHRITEITSIHRIAIRFTHLLFFAGLVFTIFLFPIKMEAYEFKHLLKPGKTLKYKHWNTHRKKVTGYSRISYEIMSKDGRKFVLETHQNTNDKGEAYSEKQLLFQADNGKLVSYEEADFRTKMKIKQQYESGHIHTQATDKDTKKKFSVKIESDLIPFEVLTLFLQKKIPKLKKGWEMDFDLYLPVIAFELEKKGIPLSFSKVGVTAKVEKIKVKGTIFGKKEVIVILIKPNSLFFSMVLPKEKSEYRFTFLNEPPFHLLVFEEHETQSILTEVNQENRGE